MEENIVDRLKRINNIRNSPEYVALKSHWEIIKEQSGAGTPRALALRDRLVKLEN